MHYLFCMFADQATERFASSSWTCWSNGSMSSRRWPDEKMRWWCLMCSVETLTLTTALLVHTDKYTLHVLIRSVFMQRCLNGGCGVSVCFQTTGWSKATVCLRSILTPAEPELAERSPGSSVTLSITVHSHSCTVCGKKFLFLFLSWCCVVFDCKMFG